MLTMLLGRESEDDRTRRAPSSTRARSAAARGRGTSRSMRRVRRAVTPTPRRCPMSMSSAPQPAPRPDDPYRDCAVYLEHGACVCSTGYPAMCQADGEQVVIDKADERALKLLDTAFRAEEARRG